MQTTEDKAVGIVSGGIEPSPLQISSRPEQAH